MFERRTRVRDQGPVSSAPTSGAADLPALYEQHLATIYRYIYSKVGNREEAEDLTSQVFLKALRGLDASRAGASIVSWLFTVARSTVADHWRAVYHVPTRSLEALLAAGWVGPAEEPAQDPAQATEQYVAELLAQLPPRYGAVLTYRFLQSCSLHETAEHMGLSEANVKVLQYRALKKAAAVARGEGDHVQPGEA